MTKVKEIMKKNYTENKVHYLSFAIPFLAMLVIFIGIKQREKWQQNVKIKMFYMKR